MPKESLYINIVHLQDMKSKDEHCKISEIIKSGNEHIAKGGTVIIQQEYINADPTELISLSSTDVFDKWINDFFELKDKSNTEATQL
jgi:hypothetical protein